VSKPVSRVLSRMIIYLGRQLPAASSDLTRELKRATCYSPIWSCSRWGLPSRLVTRPLVRSYRTVAPLPFRSSVVNWWPKRRSSFLWHFP